MDRKEHWESTYTARRSVELSWYQEYPAISLAMIRKFGVGFDDPIIDVGGGASVLADCLLEQQQENHQTPAGKSQRFGYYRFLSG